MALGTMIGFVIFMTCWEFEPQLEMEDAIDNSWWWAPVKAWARKGRALRELESNVWVKLFDPALAVGAGRARLAPVVALMGVAVWGVHRAAPGAWRALEGARAATFFHRQLENREGYFVHTAYDQPTLVRDVHRGRGVRRSGRPDLNQGNGDVVQEIRIVEGDRY